MAIFVAAAIGCIAAGSLGLVGFPVAATLTAFGTAIATKAVAATAVVAAHQTAAIVTASVASAAYATTKLGLFAHKVHSKTKEEKQQSNIEEFDAGLGAR